MKVDKPCFVDTNILVYATFEESPFFHKAIDWIEENFSSKLFVSRQVIFEYLTVVTNERLYSNYLRMEEALNNIELFLENLSIVQNEPNPDFNFLRNEIKKYNLTGKRIFDYQIVLTMKYNSIDLIATANEKDFSFCKDIEIINPFRS